MTIDVIIISNEEADRVIHIEESHFNEVKSFRIQPSKITKSLSAFANADGGMLYIGIDEYKENDLTNRTWNGFKNEEDANGHLKAFDEFFPLNDGFYYNFLKKPDRSDYVLQVEVLKSSSIKTASDGVAYLRMGAMSLPQKSEEKLRRLRLNKGIESFENETINIGLDVVENSLAIIKFMLEIIPHADPEPWLRKQQLIYNDKPRVAAVLLFADEPQVAIRYATIKVYYYNTIDEEGTREKLANGPITIEGNMYNQIYEAVRKTIEIVEHIPILAENGLEKVRYPQETLHEIITNAVIHRDYSISDSIHVRIFNNRVEVISPGILPAHVTPKNILKTRFSRNSTVVNLINKFPNPPNMNIGEGLNTAFNAVKSLNLKPPNIIQGEEDNYVKVIIKHERLARSEELIMEYLDKHDEINNRVAREICFVGSENVIKNIFIKLMKSNQIEKIPGRRGRATAYRKIGSNNLHKLL